MKNETIHLLTMKELILLQPTLRNIINGVFQTILNHPIITQTEYELEIFNFCVYSI